MVLIQKLVQEKKEQLHGLSVDYEEFHNILKRIGELNEKYILDEEVIEQLYQVLFEKQNGFVTIEGIEALLLQCLIQEQQKNENNTYLQEDQIDELEIKSNTNISMKDEEITQSYINLNLDSINELLLIYKKTLYANKIKNDEKCNLEYILKQIEVFCKKDNGNLLEKEKAISIFTMLSTHDDSDNVQYVFNSDIQSYISKFENYLLLNKYGQNNIENNQQALVFHESEDDEDSEYDDEDISKDREQQGQNRRKGFSSPQNYVPNSADLYSRLHDVENEKEDHDRFNKNSNSSTNLQKDEKYTYSYNQNNSNNSSINNGNVHYKKGPSLNYLSPTRSLREVRDETNNKLYSICEFNDVNSSPSKDNLSNQQRSCIIEDGMLSSVRDIYPIFADLAVRDEQSRQSINKIEQYYQQLSHEIKLLQQQKDEKDLQIQQFKIQAQLTAQAMSSYQKQLEDTVSQNAATESRFVKLQEQVYQLNTQITSFEKQEAEYQKEQNNLQKKLTLKESHIKEQDKEILYLKNIIKENNKLIEQQGKEIAILQGERSPQAREEIVQQELQAKVQEKLNQELIEEVIMQLKDENKEIQEQNEQLNQSVQEYIKIIEEKDDNYSTLSKQINLLKKQIQTLQDNPQSLHQINEEDDGQNENNNNNSHNSSYQNSSKYLQRSLLQDTPNFDFCNNIDAPPQFMQLASIEKDIQKSFNCLDNVNENNSGQIKLPSRQENSPTFTNSLGTTKHPSKQVKISNLPQIITYHINDGDKLKEYESNNQINKDINQQQQDQTNNKANNCFSFAAIEIIQTSRKGQIGSQQTFKVKTNPELREENIEDSNLQTSNENHPPIKSNCELPVQKDQKEQRSNELEYSPCFESRRHTNNEPMELQISCKSNLTCSPLESPVHQTPSFQQVLSGNTQFFWDYLNKIPMGNFQTNSSSSYKTQKNGGGNFSQEQQNKVVIENFPEISRVTTLNVINKNNIDSNSHSLSQLLQAFPSTDYLNLRDDSRIISLRKTFEKYNPLSQNSSLLLNSQVSFSLQSSQQFYSDSIYRINAQNQKERRIICITHQYVYILSPTENFKVVRKFKVWLINRMTFSNTNSNLCVIHVLHQSEYVIESCRRFDLNIYLTNLFKYHLKLPIYMVCFAENLKIQSKKLPNQVVFLSPLSEKEIQMDILPKINSKNNTPLRKQELANQQTPNINSDFEQACQNDFKNDDDDNNNNNKINIKNDSDKKEDKKHIKSSQNKWDESKVIQIQLKKPQSLLKSFFLTPWKQCFMKVISHTIHIYKDNKCTTKELEIVLNEIKINQKSQGENNPVIIQDKQQQQQQLQSENEIIIIDNKQNSYQIKIINPTDYDDFIQFSLNYQTK